MKPKIALFCGGVRGHALLQHLLKKKENVILVFIYRQEAQEPQRLDGEMKRICDRQGIPSFVCRKITAEEQVEILMRKPDVAFVCGWRTLLSADVYKNIPQGCLAAHDSLLPQYRGFCPTAWSIRNGERETGVTLFKIGDGVVDSGDIFAQKKIPIGPDDTMSEIYPQVVRDTIDLHDAFLSALKKNTVRFTPQDERLATYTKKRGFDDCRIDWDKPVAEVYNHIRALGGPYPHAWTTHQGKLIFVTKALLPKGPKDFTDKMPGTVLKTTPTGVLVACRNGCIMLHEVMTKTGNRHKAATLLNAAGIVLGKTEEGDS